MILLLPIGLAALAGEPVDLRGLWVGDYGPHGDEMVEIAHDGDEVVAVKRTGDPNVPAGQVTFRARLVGWSGDGFGQIAETGFKEARFVSGRLRVLGKDRVSFEWEGLGTVVYTRVAPARLT